LEDTYLEVKIKDVFDEMLETHVEHGLQGGAKQLSALMREYADKLDKLKPKPHVYAHGYNFDEPGEL